VRRTRGRADAVASREAGRVRGLRPGSTTIEGKVHTRNANAWRKRAGGGITSVAGFEIDLVVGTSRQDFGAIGVDGQPGLVLFVSREGRTRAAIGDQHLGLGSGWDRGRQQDEQCDQESDAGRK
jgi:hypothetical protein